MNNFYSDASSGSIREDDFDRSLDFLDEDPAASRADENFFYGAREVFDDAMMRAIGPQTCQRIAQ